MKSFVMVRQAIVGMIPIPTLLALLVLISYCGASSSALEHKCMHDTEEMQTLFYGPIVDNITGLRHAFTPQGILERTAPQQYQPMPPPDAPEEVHRAFHATAVGNMRIVTSTIDLDDNTKYCTKEGEVVQDFQGGTIACTAEDIFTEAKKEILLKKVLPAALELLSSALKVNRVDGKLVVVRGCNYNSVPAFHASEGIPDADYILYVSAAPTAGNAIAWAGMCEKDAKGRPIDGRANFGPKYLVWKDLDIFGQRELVRTAVHEILHALGFTSWLWTDHFPTGNPVVTERRRGKTVHYFSSKKVVEKAREYFNCPTMTGPEIEDEGAVGTVGSHWKRRSHMDDIMVSNGNRWAYLSPITLAVMEDSGHYTIDWSKAETPKWMYKAGCGVLTNKCNTRAGGMGKYFCDSNLYACTPDHRTMGYCNIGIFSGELPPWAQYFTGEPNKGGTSPLMDFCPIVTTYPNRQCDNPANKNTNTTLIPLYYGNDGRCFRTDGVIRGSSSSSSVANSNCLQTRCVNNAVEFKVPGNDAWIPCPSKGAQVVLLQYGYKGTVICPDPRIICDGLEIMPPQIKPQEITKPPPTEGPAPPKKTTTKPPINVPTPPNDKTTPTEAPAPPKKTTKPSINEEIPTTRNTSTKTPGTVEVAVKSASAISSIISAVLIPSVVFLYFSFH